MVKTRGKKILISLLSILVLGIGIVGIGMGYFIQQTNNLKKEFAEYIEANPDDVAIVTYTIDQNGEPIEDENAIFHNADQPLVLASTMKLAVLIAYAEEVANDRLDPNEQISVTDWEKYYVPMTDGGAHTLGLKSMALEADELGFALDQTAQVSLDDIARIMIHYSGNAATDYLLMRIGDEKMDNILAEVGLEHQTHFRLILGTVLAIFNHEYIQPDIHQLQAIIEQVSEGQTEYVDHLVDLYLNDPTWRTKQIQYMTHYNTSVNLSEQDIWAYQVAASKLFPTGTAREYALLVAQIARGQLISAEVSEIMQQHLESVPSDWPLRLLFFDGFGAKDGVTAGVLTIASYAVPRRGDLAGQNRVVVVLANHMPLDKWSNQLQLEGHYLLQTDLAQATGVFDDIRTIK